MIIILLIILIAGIFETWLYTGWAITANQKKVYLSSILMFIYMLTYLLILNTAFKDDNSILIILVYSISCMIGNFIRVKQEKRKE